MRSKETARTHRTEAERQSILEDFERSGKTRQAFCKEAGIPASTLALWQRRARVGSVPTQFVDLTPVARPASPWSIDIAFPDGTTARVRG
jgi:transposase-like protein